MQYHRYYGVGMTTLQEARTYVQDMLYMGDADVVHRALCTARRDARSHRGYSAASEDTYRMYFLALADITGNERYRAAFWPSTASAVGVSYACLPWR